MNECASCDLTTESGAKVRKENVWDLSGFIEYYLYRPLQIYTFQTSYKLALL